MAVAEFSGLAPVADLPPGSLTRWEVRGEGIVVANVDGAFHAVQDTCPHAGASLAEGTLDGACLQCPLHAATFDVRTGQVLGGPADEGLRTYPVWLHDGVVKVAVDAQAALARAEG